VPCERAHHPHAKDAFDRTMSKECAMDDHRIGASNTRIQQTCVPLPRRDVASAGYLVTNCPARTAVPRAASRHPRRQRGSSGANIGTSGRKCRATWRPEIDSPALKSLVDS
jgi:hypothetical protein